jgi:hypothetical protein
MKPSTYGPYGVSIGFWHNMPIGATFDAPVLTDEDAYDVGAYIISQNRPQKANFDRDFPIRLPLGLILGDQRARGIIAVPRALLDGGKSPIQVRIHFPPPQSQART